MQTGTIAGLEHKFLPLNGDVTITNGSEIEGYASYFGVPDQSNDVVEAGAYGTSLKALADRGRTVKMLWQHDPTQPIGVWSEVHEDAKGLYVKGRILPESAKGAEAIRLVEAGAIDGLSIGYRTVKAVKNTKGQRLLSELELWEVSLVTFPMLPEARIGAKGDLPIDAELRELVAVLDAARTQLANL